LIAPVFAFADLPAGPYFLRYSLADGNRPWEHVGNDLDEAIASRRTSKLSKQTFPSSKIRMKPADENHGMRML
jgi:hypothetical protein